VRLIVSLFYVKRVISLKKAFNNLGVKASVITIIVNFILFIFKLVAGIIAKSNAMISDSVHSLSDVLTTIIVILGLIISSKEADEKHPYGHERIESVFAIVLSFFLFLTGVGIVYVGLRNIVLKDSIALEMPGVLALMAAFVSILVKEGMYHYTKKIAKKIASTSLEADAWHHRSDAMSSIGSFIGILGARLGFTILDPICSIVICVLIIKSSIEIFIGAVAQMLDVACPEEIRNHVINIIKKENEILEISDLKTRIFGSKIYIDVDVTLAGDITLNAANIIVERIHDNIENNIREIKHCNIHILPY